MIKTKDISGTEIIQVIKKSQEKSKTKNSRWTLTAFRDRVAYGAHTISNYFLGIKFWFQKK